MKAPRSINTRRLPAAIAAAVFTFVFLFALAQLSEPDSPPSCPASRSGGVDIVASGPRPCVLHAPAGAGVAPGTDTGHVIVPGSSGKTTAPGKVPGGSVKQPKVPAAPKAPPVKVPAAPAPKAPAPPAVRR